MPIGYLVTTGLIAAVVLAAVSGHRPRRSSPFRPSYSIGLLINWPLAVFVVLAVSTALAIDQTGAGSPVSWIGLGLAIFATAGLAVLRRRARETGPVLERALDEGREQTCSTSIATVRVAPAAPTLVHLHPLFGSKRIGTRYLFHRLARRGWLCVSANYRRTSGGFSDPLIDVKKVIAWVHEHGGDYGADPNTVFPIEAFAADVRSQRRVADPVPGSCACLQPGAQAAEL
jgi:acetyl esterase/lipase